MEILKLLGSADESETSAAFSNLLVESSLDTLALGALQHTLTAQNHPSV